MRAILSLARRLRGLLVPLAFAATTTLAQASLIGQPITVQLVSPSATGCTECGGPVDVSDTVTVGSGVELGAGDGSNVGSFMLTGISLAGPQPLAVSEFIDLSGGSIAMRLLGYAGEGETGWDTGARYVFTGLQQYSGGTIIGIDVSGSGLTSSVLADLADIVSFDAVASSITVALDRIAFVNAAGIDVADLTIRLLTRTDDGKVPEPGSIALAGLALLALAAVMRRRASARQG